MVEGREWRGRGGMVEGREWRGSVYVYMRGRSNDSLSHCQEEALQGFVQPETLEGDNQVCVCVCVRVRACVCAAISNLFPAVFL